MKTQVHNRKLQNSNGNDSKKLLEDSDLVALLDVYLSEWQHRDSMLWSQTFKMFYASLIVIMLPNITSTVGFTINGISHWVFRSIGILLSITFLYIGLGYAKRLKAISNTYKNIIELLPNDKIKRVSMEDITLFENKKSKMIGKFYRKLDSYLDWRISTFLVIAMFLALIIIAIFMLIWGDTVVPNTSETVGAVASSLRQWTV